MKLSARNQFKGIVTNVNEGAVNGIVSIKVNDEVVSSTISMNAIKELGLKEGVEAVAIIKATEGLSCHLSLDYHPNRYNCLQSIYMSYISTPFNVVLKTTFIIIIQPI